jgi:hypothetical protein
MLLQTAHWQRHLHELVGLLTMDGWLWVVDQGSVPGLVPRAVPVLDSALNRL